MRDVDPSDLRVRYRVAAVNASADFERVELLPVDDKPRWTIGRVDMRIVIFLRGADLGTLRVLDVVAIDVVPARRAEKGAEL